MKDSITDLRRMYPNLSLREISRMHAHIIIKRIVIDKLRREYELNVNNPLSNKGSF